MPSLPSTIANPLAAIPAGLRNFGGLSGAGAERTRTRIVLSGRLTGPVTTRQLIRLDAPRGSESDASILHQPLPGDASLGNPIDCGGIYSDRTSNIAGDDASFYGAITLNEGNLDQLRVGVTGSNGINAESDLVGDVTVENGSIPGSVVARNVLGDITAKQITRVFARNNIGSATNPVSITATRQDTTPPTGTSTDWNIEFVLANGSIWANISASDSPTNFGTIRRVIASSDVISDGTTPTEGTAPALGHLFKGSLSAYWGLGYGPQGDNKAWAALSAGTIDADVIFWDRLYSYLIGGTITPTTRVIVGAGVEKTQPVLGNNSLPFPIRVSNAAALQGQFIFNASNAGGVWSTNPDAEARIGPSPTTFVFETAASQPDQAPYYDRSSEDLGGGAIGLVPFRFHRFDSEPDQLTGVTCDNTFTVEYYGPLQALSLDPTGEMPVRVERAPLLNIQPTGGGCYEFRDVTRFYDFQINPTGTNDRQIAIYRASGTIGAECLPCVPNQPCLMSSWIYRIRPVNPSLDLPEQTGGTLNELLCDLSPFATSSFPRVYTPGAPVCPQTPGDENYQVFVYLQTPGRSIDLNASGLVEIGDGTAWVEMPMDLNQDGIADGQDLGGILENLGQSAE